MQGWSTAKGILVTPVLLLVLASSGCSESAGPVEPVELTPEQEREAERKLQEVERQEAGEGVD